MDLHAFVALPAASAREFDCAAIYAEYVKPSLEDAGFTVTFASALSSEDARAVRFEKLLLADLVVVDLSLDDTDVWYELGLRHALLARGVVLIDCASTARSVVSADSAVKLHYHLRDGRPDAEQLLADRQTLARLALRNAAPWQGRPGKLAQPLRQVFLFSGHMIDATERPTPRFPADKEEIAAAAIAAQVDALGMGAKDLAICGGACGGDLLFAEAALRRACPVHLYLQFDEADFVHASVAFAGPGWVDRYRRVRDHPLTRVHIQPQELGPLDGRMNAYVRNNLWQLCTALVQGAQTMRFIALWNGEGGAGPGGTQNMVETVRRYAGQVSVLDTRALFGL